MFKNEKNESTTSAGTVFLCIYCEMGQKNDRCGVLRGEASLHRQEHVVRGRQVFATVSPRLDEKSVHNENTL